MYDCVDSNGDTKTSNQKISIREETLHFSEKLLVSLHLDHCFIHLHHMSSLLLRAASHNTIGDTRQRPKTTNKISQACEKQIFHTIFV